ncbi:hypothetical protein F2Q68_00040088 [Brassica cretica]|uniref:Major facilitator superfamily (MFS) profile domain-containing protein n=1 Tax=Brassica cretica TaxID=69181 RepID=A0A8S9MH68_BRACR|nr:hypothetical protein F2Q68_00040088 [Brassica cretica]
MLESFLRLSWYLSREEKPSMASWTSSEFLYVEIKPPDKSDFLFELFCHGYFWFNPMCAHVVTFKLEKVGEEYLSPEEKPSMASWTSSEFLYVEIKPPGIHFLERFKRSGKLSFKQYQWLVFGLTFIAYIAFHASRKPNSIVKGTLSKSPTGHFKTTDQGGWAPFDGPDGTALLGQIDLAFLSVYAVGMFVIYLTIPALFLYRTYGHISMTINIILMFTAGVFVNGPYALITTAVAADLGTHKSLKGNARALATVTAIIDGTGSVGAAIGPVLTGYIAAISWDAVFYMLMTAALISGLLLTKLIITEVKTLLYGSSEEDEIVSPASEPRPPIDVLI